MTDIKLPELGEGINSVEISDVLIKTGDNIKLDDPLIVVETEKASMEIPATSSGLVNKVYVNKGDTISPGDIMISIDANSTTIPQSSIPMKDENLTIESNDLARDKSISRTTTTQTVSTESRLGKPALASPSVRRFARELGCDLKKVNGLGPKGRITQEDVQKYIKTRLSELSDKGPALALTAPGQNIDFSQFGAIEIKPLNKIKRITIEKQSDTGMTAFGDFIWDTLPLFVYLYSYN